MSGTHRPPRAGSTPPVHGELDDRDIPPHDGALLAIAAPAAAVAVRAGGQG
ncbi:MAG: hypothetical protein ACLP50_19625 [Solirubrobacteraceae bacterium]